MRMYPDGLRSLVEGWSKAFADGAAHTAPLLRTLITCWRAGSIATVLALAGAWFWLDRPAVGLYATLYAAYAGQLFVLMRGIGRFHGLAAICYPAPLAFFIAIFARSVWRSKHRRGVTWKGRGLSNRSEA